MYHQQAAARSEGTRGGAEIGGSAQPVACGKHADDAQAESFSRPLRRRPARMARPARVDMRSRKPWTRARRRLFGWKVRLLTMLSVRRSIRAGGARMPAPEEWTHGDTGAHRATRACWRPPAWTAACEDGRIGWEGWFTKVRQGANSGQTAGSLQPADPQAVDNGVDICTHSEHPCHLPRPRLALERPGKSARPAVVGRPARSRPRVRSRVQ